jgi:hypothetical protein
MRVERKRVPAGSMSEGSISFDSLSSDQQSRWLTKKVLKERSEQEKPDFGLMLDIYRLMDNTNVTAVVWEFSCLPYQKSVNAFWLCVRYHRYMKRRGSDRPIRVYDGHNQSLKQLLDNQDDGALLVIERAEWLRKKGLWYQTTKVSWKAFLLKFRKRFPRNQIVLLCGKDVFNLIPDPEPTDYDCSRPDGWSYMQLYNGRVFADMSDEETEISEDDSEMDKPSEAEILERKAWKEKCRFVKENRRLVEEDISRFTGSQ